MRRLILLLFGLVFQAFFVTAIALISDRHLGKIIAGAMRLLDTPSPCVL
jgi:hypothetical protein